MFENFQKQSMKIRANFLRAHLNLVISKTDVSEYPLVSKNMVWTHFLFVFL